MVYRKLLVLVWLGLVLAAAMLSWPHKQAAEVEAPSYDPLRYQIMSLQVKLSLGARELVSNPDAGNSESGQAISAGLESPLIEVLRPDASQPLLTKFQYVLANFFKLEDPKVELEDALQKSNDFWDKKVLEAYQPGVTLNPTDLQELRVSLGEYAPFLNATPQSLKESHPEIVEASLNTLYKILIGITILGVLVILALISFAVFSFLILRKKLIARNVPVLSQPDCLLETFCLYLAGMILTSIYILPFAAEHTQLSPLYLNVVAIPLLLSVLVWPLLRGVGAVELRDSLALNFGGILKTFTDALLAPFAYLAGWVVIAVVLVLYALALQIFSVDPSSGAHPVVPMLLGGGDNKMVVAIALLAVIVAPFVEEIMFRGALYGWLRSFLPAWSAIIISASCFAFMHPQGAIGLVPLASIGILLAILREWRGSLVAPMIAHACFNGGTLILLVTLFR